MNMSDNVVVFNPTEFKEIYPEFGTFSDVRLTWFFNKAELLFNNTKQSCIKDLRKRKILLYLATAHIAQLQKQVDSGNTLVGRVSSASQGSVSIGSDYGALGKDEKWWVQTPYGAEFWQMTAMYRTSIYVVTNFAMPVDRTRRW
jgi:hypothetical protein